MARATSNPQTPNLAAIRHPLYDQFQADWIKLGHVREGTGGFMDGTYLIGHPREYVDHTAAVPVTPTKKLKARRAIARYDNLAASLLDSKKAALFREKPTRRVGTGNPGDSELEQWWQNVDGQGHGIDECVPLWWDLAATFGHVVLYFELPDDAREQPVVCTYTPLDVLNWLVDETGKIIAVVLAEAVPATKLEDSISTKTRVRVVTETGWATYGPRGGLQGKGDHNLGRVPVVYLYGKRRAIFPDVGQSVLGDPRQHIDLYNLTSEKRELLRNQTFSFINIPLGTGPDAIDVQKAKDMLGETIGTSNVIFSAAAAQILAADAANVAAYQDEERQLKRDIYREAGVPWESDSKDAEAQGSLEQKREELNTRLAMYADECECAEYELAELWYRFRHGADRGEDQLEKDGVVIDYPDRFDRVSLDDIIKQAQGAQSIGMPPEVLKLMRKAMLDKFVGLGHLTPDERTQLEAAIDSAAADVTPAEEARQRLKAAMDGVPMRPRRVASA